MVSARKMTRFDDCPFTLTVPRFDIGETETGVKFSVSFQTEELNGLVLAYGTVTDRRGMEHAIEFTSAFVRNHNMRNAAGGTVDATRRKAYVNNCRLSLTILTRSGLKYEVGYEYKSGAAAKLLGIVCSDMDEDEIETYKSLARRRRREREGLPEL